MFFQAFLEPSIKYGVCFEAHPQNVLARYDIEAPHKLKGFIVRDLCGVRIHAPTLQSSTGIILDPIADARIMVQSDKALFERMYQCMIQLHLHQLIRVLGLHYNGVGWGVVRRRFTDVVPRDHALTACWYGEEALEIKVESFLKMTMALGKKVSSLLKFVSSSVFSLLIISVPFQRVEVYKSLPNHLLYTGSETSEETPALSTLVVDSLVPLFSAVGGEAAGPLDTKSSNIPLFIIFVWLRELITRTLGFGPKGKLSVGGPSVVVH